MRRIAVLLAVAVVLLDVPVAPATPSILRGFTDFDAFTAPSPADELTGAAHAKAAGAQIVRFSLGWGSIAPQRPPSRSVEADPRWSGYDWGGLDQIVRSITASGLQPLPVVSNAPAWAEGPGRPPVSAAAPAGTWRPSAPDLQAFASALARRYSGSFPDPSRPGSSLPAVRRWQVWNEPNLTNYLTPQWTRRAHGYVARSPATFRGLVNAFYRGVKAIGSGNEVITAGTAPFGDLRAGQPRIPPAKFWRMLLCVSGRSRPRAHRCPHVSFDAYAHHPYPIAGPTEHASNADDVEVPDLSRISRPMRAAVAAGTVRPRGPKPLWVTEISWDSRPDPQALSLATQARYAAGVFAVLARQHVRAVIWYGLRDQDEGPSWASTFQSGVFFRGGSIEQDRPKPSFIAFRFPFSAYRSRGRAHLFGIAPNPGSVVVERQAPGGWTTLRTLATSGGVFSASVKLGPGVVLRARSASDTSLPWTV